jgi:MFS family permease
MSAAADVPVSPQDGMPLRSVASGSLAVLAGASPMIFAGTLVVQISDDLEIGTAAFGWAFAMYFVASGLVSRWSGQLVDAIGWHRSTWIAASLSTICLLGVATLARSYVLLALFLAIGGLAQSLGMPSSNLTLTRTVPARHLAFAFGIKQTANPIAGLLAGLSIPAIALTVGWRWAFALAIVLPISTMAVTPLRDRHALDSSRQRTPRWEPAELDRAALVILAVAGGLAALTATALSAFVVASAVESGINASRAGIYVAVANIVGMSVRVGAGWLTGRFASMGIRPASSLLVLGSLGYGLLATGQQSLVLLGMAFAYGAGSGWPGLFQFGVSAYNPASPASATGFVQIGVLFGAACGPVLAGTLVSVAGYRAVWLITGAVALVAATLMLVAATLLERSRTAASHETPA